MSDLIIAVFGNQSAAFAAGQSLAAFQRDMGVEPEDIVVVSRDATGRVTVNQSIDLATGKPLGGGAWGVLIGMMFLAGRKPKGSSTGLAGQLGASGLEADFVHEVMHALDSGGAAVGLHVRMLGADRVRARLSDMPGNARILQARLSAETEEALHDLQAQIPQAAPADRDGSS